MEECSWFSTSGRAFGEMWDASFKNDNVLIGKNPFHHPCYRFMQLLFSSCVILIITKDEIQSKAQYLRCYDLLEIQV